MFKVKVLNHEVIEQLLNMKDVIEAVESVYRQKSQEKGIVFPMVFHEFEPGVADMDIKSGHLKDSDIFGLKVVTWYGSNKDKNLPLLIGTTLVMDASTGAPIGLLSAEHITGMRTGAAGAIGAKYLARKESENFLMVGTGHQSTFQIAAALSVLDAIKVVRIYNPLHFENAKSLAAKLPEILKTQFLNHYEGPDYEFYKAKFNVEFIAVDSLEEATKLSDVIVTATPSKKPMIMKAWVKPGTHISTVGADMEGKQEIDEQLFGIARVFVDDIPQAISVGETEIPIKKGVITAADIIAEIGDVLAGKAFGRTSNEEITIYDTTGIALQDLIVAKLAIELANKKGLGTTVDL